MIRRFIYSLIIFMFGLLLGLGAAKSDSTISKQVEPIDISTCQCDFKHGGAGDYQTFKREVEEAKGTVIEGVIVEKEPEVLMSDNDIELIALVTMAEAEGECEEGKRLVIDTILNRMDSDKFPDTASGVIYQKHQFTSMTNGRVDQCYVRDDICQLVREELESRTNHDVMFFRTGKYGYGSPLFKVGNHYFSGL